MVAPTSGYDTIKANLQLHVQLTEEEFAAFTTKLQYKTYKKGEFILHAGQICRSLAFVNKGCLRSYYTDMSGIEHNVLFHEENWWAADVASFTRQKKALYNIDVLEQAELFLLSYHDLEELLVNIPKLERFFRYMYQNGFSFFQNRLVDMLSDTAEQRYRKFRRIYPSLELRIPQKQIASFLGITPVFLSMLRKKHTR